MAFLLDPDMLEAQVISSIFGNHLSAQCSSLSLNNRVTMETEDGIPIRKIYVGNLPNKTTRQELLECFTQFGNIKNCWVKSEALNQKSFAFITYIEPTDAHKALNAPRKDYFLRGKFLKVLPADSWHQPTSDSSGNVIWNNKRPSAFSVQTEALDTDPTEASTSNASLSREDEDRERQYDILDLLNHDCVTQIMSYLPLHDLVRSEAVSKRWRATVHDYFMSFREFKTSTWRLNELTTNKLRQLLQRMSNLRRLHIDDYGMSLNDRTAQVIAKFSLQLEQLTVENMSTKFWTPVATGCKNLQSITFNSCDCLNDQSLISLLNVESSIECLRLERLHEVKGTFLSHVAPKLRRLSINLCSDFKTKPVIESIDKLKDLKYLCMSVYYSPTYKLLPELSKLVKLEELHLSDVYGNPLFNDWDADRNCWCEEMCQAVKCLKELRCFSFTRSRCLHDKLLKQIAESCPKLTTLDITACISQLDDQLETMAGLSAVVDKCCELQHVNISNNQRIPDMLKVLSKCRTLRTLVARGHPTLKDGPVGLCIANCHQLEVIDVGNCSSLTDCTVSSCVRELEAKPRAMTLYIDAKKDTAEEFCSTCPLLTVVCESSSRHTFGPLLEEDSDEQDHDLEHYNDLFSDDSDGLYYDSDDSLDYVIDEFGEIITFQF